MIKNIVFDMGNVILRWDPEYIASKLSNDAREREVIIRELFNSKQWQLLDQGLIDLDEALTQIKRQTDNNNHQILEYALYHWYDYFEAFAKIPKLIKELKSQDYRIYLLSNCSVQFDEYYQNITAFNYFDDFYISARYHYLKPDLKIYQHFLTKFNLEAQECIFIDDVQANVEGARKAGMKAYLHDGDIDKLRCYLEANI